MSEKFKLTPEQQKETAERTKSDAELIKGGARYGEEGVLEPTGEQIESIKREREREIMSLVEWDKTPLLENIAHDYYDEDGLKNLKEKIKDKLISGVTFSPDKKRFAFVEVLRGNNDIYLTDKYIVIDGKKKEIEHKNKKGGRVIAKSFSGDSKHFVFISYLGHSNLSFAGEDRGPFLHNYAFHFDNNKPIDLKLYGTKSDLRHDYLIISPKNDLAIAETLDNKLVVVLTESDGPVYGEIKKLGYERIDDIKFIDEDGKEGIEFTDSGKTRKIIIKKEKDEENIITHLEFEEK